MLQALLLLGILLSFIFFYGISVQAFLLALVEESVPCIAIDILDFVLSIGFLDVNLLQPLGHAFGSLISTIRRSVPLPGVGMNTGHALSPLRITLFAIVGILVLVPLVSFSFLLQECDLTYIQIISWVELRTSFLSLVESLRCPNMASMEATPEHTAMVSFVTLSNASPAHPYSGCPGSRTDEISALARSFSVVSTGLSGGNLEWFRNGEVHC